MTIDGRMTWFSSRNPSPPKGLRALASTLRAVTALVELAQRRDCVGQLVGFLELPDAQTPLGDCKAPGSRRCRFAQRSSGLWRDPDPDHDETHRG